MHKSHGVSLIELLFCLLLLALLLALATPSFSEMLARERARSASNSLRSALDLARESAIMTGQAVSVAAPGEDDWAGGWRIFHDRNRDGLQQSGERTLAVQPPLDGVKILTDRTTRRYIHYRADGVSIQPSGAFHAGYLAICSRSATAYRVVVNRSGRIRSERGEAARICTR